MANPKIDFAVAAAYGINDKVVATWNPDLPRTPRVMVPIHLDVLMVREKGGTWADCAMREIPGASGNDKSTFVQPPPFTDLAAPRERGAYLHWALPDGLTNGQAGTANGVAYPAAKPDATSPQQVSFQQIPDRWLVMRLSPSTLPGVNRRMVRGWIIEAGGEAPVAKDLTGWTEPGKDAGKAPDKPLTALGHGDPAWSAYFDNVQNRLGFYDPLNDVQTGPIAYLVCGWYADPAADPLGSGITSLADFHARMDALGWDLDADELEEAHNYTGGYVNGAVLAGLTVKEAYVPKTATAQPQGAPLPRAALANVAQVLRADTGIVLGTGATPAGLDGTGRPLDGHYTTHGEWWPKLTVYHGSVVAIGWPGRGYPGMPDGLVSEEAGGPPSAASVDVAFGNTITEALATLLAKTSNNPHEAYALEAFMVGALDEFNEADGEARVDARLHANAFASLPGGERTEIIEQQPPGPPASTPGNIPKPKPGVFGAPPKGVVTGTLGAGAQTEVFNLSMKDTRKAVAIQPAPKFTRGGMTEVKLLLDPDIKRTTPAAEDGGRKQVEVKRTLPRYFVPADPVFLVQGCGRSFKHRGDGRFDEHNKLICRLSGFCLTGYMSSAITGQTVVAHVGGEDILAGGIDNGSVPIECVDLLHELGVLDPGSAAVIASKGAAPTSLASSAAAATVSGTQRMVVEQTLWWATRDPRTDHSALLARSGFIGTLPSPIAVNPPVDPWVPLHLDWRVQFISAGETADDWDLGEIDFDTGERLVLPPPDDITSGHILQGRTLLSAGAATTAAASLRRSLKQAANAGGSISLTPGTLIAHYSEVSLQILTGIANTSAKAAVKRAASTRAAAGVGTAELDHVADLLEQMDVVSGALENFHTSLRGGIEGDGVTITRPDGAPPPRFFRLRTGFLRVLRLRVVDCFGQVLDLAGSSANKPADPNGVSVSSPLQVIDGATKKVRPDLVEMAPRFTSPTRLMLRYTDAADSEADASATVSPVCGFVMPNHLDGDLLFFDVAGDSRGTVRPDPGAGVVWEDAPGRPATVGKLPARAMDNAALAGIAQGLLDWGIADTTPDAPGAETALSALLRIIDSTLWSVDPFGHVGDEHLALLIGHPVAVMRAHIWLEVKEAVDVDAVATIAVPLRLGALTHWQDGLLGYFVNDDYHKLYCTDRAVAGFARQIGPGEGFQQSVTQTAGYYDQFSKDIGVDTDSTKGATPVDHPYVDDSGVVWIRPNQKVTLTLLVEPHTVVHATTGLVPRKEIGMRREWVAAALAKLAPTFRFGPVLVDPKRIRMPVASELHGTWTWSHRIDATTWVEDPVINSQGDARLSPDPAQGQEGWLKMTPVQDVQT
jgi:hypothetical protein